jgi:predicted RNase H-like nuclease (RuvC/YqgF family)
MEEWLTIAEIAKKAKVAETSVRRYIKLFKEYLPGKQIGRTWRYIPDVIQIIERISASYQAGQSTQEIFQMLRQNFPQVMNVEEEKHHITTTSPPQHHMTEIAAVQVEALRQIAGILNKIVTQEQKIETLFGEVQTLSDEVIFLRRKLKDKKVQHIQEQEIITRLDQLEKEQRESNADITQKDKVIFDQQAVLEAREREIEALKAEVERLRRSWWKRLWKK